VLTFNLMLTSSYKTVR